jgi:prepilin-type N-terminal cleavage/methylation domain-containing protein
MRHFYARRLFQAKAFTLVELLTVIAIIGILMGLLLPAVVGTLAAARARQCSARLGQMGIAIHGYVTDRDSLPGYLQKFGEFQGGIDPADPNSFGGAVPRHFKIGGWPIAAMSKLGNQPLYEVWSMDRYPLIADANAERPASFDGYSAAASPVYEAFICPSGSGHVSLRGLNHYVANTGIHAPAGFSYQRPGRPMVTVDFLRSMSPANGLFNNQYAGFNPSNPSERMPVGKPIRMGDITDGLSSTLLLSENHQAMPLHMTALTGNASHLTSIQSVSGKEVIASPPVARYLQGVVWHFEDPTGFASAPPVNPVHQINGGDVHELQMSPTNFAEVARPSSLHIGGAHVAMADGSIRFLVDTIDYRVYQAMMTPKGRSSDVPMTEYLVTESY